MRRGLVLTLLALVLPIASWAKGINIINKFGSISITNAGIGLHGSEMVQYGTVGSHAGSSLGSVAFTTGPLLSGSITSGGMFAGGQGASTFTVMGKGGFGQPKGVIFAGYFDGPVIWTLVSKNHAAMIFQLSGTIVGQLADGRTVRGTTTQTFYTVPGQLEKGVGHLSLGNTNLGTPNLTTPEPATLGLLGTGLLGLASLQHRKRASGKT